ncbi:MAG: hypothetical protein SGILL_008042, partial [Bacillariaceae sp.]
MWRTPTGGKMAASFHRPAGVCRRLGVLNLSFSLPNKGKKTTTNEKVFSLLKSSASKQVVTRSTSPDMSVTKTDCRKDVVSIYGKDYHKDNKNVTQTQLMDEMQRDWTPVLAAGHIIPQWNSNGEIVGSKSQTTCKRLLQLLKEGKLEDLQAGRERVLYHGLKHIPTDATSILSAIVEMAKPSSEFYSMPLLVSETKICSIERLDSSTTTVQVSIGIYASRLLFEIMTQDLQIIMTAFEENSVNITQELSSPPSLPSSGRDDPVFASDPNGPKVHDDDSDDLSFCSSQASINDRKSSLGRTNTEFEDAGASDGTLDAFTPSGFLKLIENTGCNMDNFEAIENLLEDKLQVELMPHQKHALSFMWKAEHLPGTGINGLLWEQREFPDGGSYYFSPVLGQLRLSLSDEPVRGGVLADEMGLGKTCSVLALILASLPDIKREVSFEKKDTATSATLI